MRSERTGKGEGEGEMGKGVRVMRGKEYVDGDRWAGSGFRNVAGYNDGMDEHVRV